MTPNPPPLDAADVEACARAMEDADTRTFALDHEQLSRIAVQTLISRGYASPGTVANLKEERDAWKLNYSELVPLHAKAEAERDSWRTKALVVEKHPAVVALVAERDEARLSATNFEMRAGVYLRDRDAALARVAALEGALRTYGMHRVTCNASLGDCHADCTCGLDLVLAQTEAKP